MFSLAEAWMRAERWEPINGIDGPSDGISFSYDSSGSVATVSMGFSDAGRSNRNLTLRFRHVAVLAGEDEAPGGFISAPTIESLPKLEHGLRPSWTFPLLRLLDSKPLDQYQRMRPEKLGHFFLVSFDNLVHVIASVDVEASWS
jgi:hypothetical protein